MLRSRPITSLTTLLAVILAAPVAQADDRACYQLASVETPSDHEPEETPFAPGWYERWDVGTLAGLDVRHSALSAPLLQVDLARDLQSATAARTIADGTLGPAGRYAWSRPPDVWCSHAPGQLQVVIQGQGDSLRFSTVPGASLALDGLTRVDDEVLTVVVETPGLRTTSVTAAPRVDGPPAFTLVLTITPDRSRPELVVPVHHRYERMPTLEGVTAGAPTPPSVIVGSAGDEGGTPLTVEPIDSEEEEDEKSYLGDVNSGWFHLGGGGALIRPGTGAFTGGGRFALGFGGYTFFFYGGAGFEMDWSPVVPWKVHGVAYLGVAIPIPVVHPLIGVKVAGGMATDPLGGRIGPSLGIGGQAGVIIRAFDRGGGFRFMVEPTFGLTGMGNDTSTFELWFVAAAVF